ELAWHEASGGRQPPVGAGPWGLTPPLARASPKRGQIRPGGGGRMLDLHCHILPGVDDGPPSPDQPLPMARFRAPAAIPHVPPPRTWRLAGGDVLAAGARLTEEPAGAGVPLTVLPGSEVQVTDAAAYRREFEAGLYCPLGDGRAFTLLEFNWKGELYPPDAPE